MSREKLYSELINIRKKLEKIFSPETALGEFNKEIPSTGHCAAVAAIIKDIYGGDMVSTYINDISHWFNRITINDQKYDIDLTGDQFDKPKIQIEVNSDLYPDTRIRKDSELNKETLKRVKILFSRLKEI